MSSSPLFSLDELRAAERVVRKAFPATPALVWPLLSQRLGAEVVVKHENHLPTGAFKVRGGLTYFDWLMRSVSPPRGIIAATRGNHGQSLAYATSRAGVGATIIVPHGNSTEKNAAMRALGAELVEYGADFQEALEQARRLAVTRGLHLVPAFDRELVKGVATYGLELFEARPDLDVLYVPIGLGSGICGCIAARDALGLKTEIVGVQATGAPSYALSLKAGHVVSTNAADTRADGLATRTPDDEAFNVIRGGASRITLVDDSEIAQAVRRLWTDTHNLTEGAGAAALAAATQERVHNLGKRVGLVLSGGNIDLAVFRDWILAAA